MDTFSIEQLAAFLVEAKLHTYAAQDNEASVSALLPGSKQLEFRQGDFVYRDVYFGGHFFAGQETIYWQEQPIWSMVYAGGLLVEAKGDVIDAGMVYAFLRAAMRQVRAERPFRGPSRWQDCAWLYEDQGSGDLKRFNGKERILFQGDVVYALDYSGGLLVF